jgi:hypothetical protein
MTMTSWSPEFAGGFGAWIQKQCDDLLEGIDISPAQRTQALAIVAADAHARRELVKADPSQFGEQVAMMASRDAAIRALMTTDVARERLDQNASRWTRIRSGEDPSPPPTCAV